MSACLELSKNNSLIVTQAKVIERNAGKWEWLVLRWTVLEGAVGKSGKELRYKVQSVPAFLFGEMIGVRGDMNEAYGLVLVWLAATWACSDGDVRAWPNVAFNNKKAVPQWTLSLEVPNNLKRCP